MCVAGRVLVEDFQHLRLPSVVIHSVRVVSQQFEAELFRDDRHVFMEHDGRQALNFDEAAASLLAQREFKLEEGSDVKLKRVSKST